MKKLNISSKIILLKYLNHQVIINHFPGQIQQNQNILNEIQQIKINFAFLTRSENLKDINKKFFYLEPYDLSNIKIMDNSKDE